MNLSGTKSAGIASPEDLITNTRIFMFDNNDSDGYYKELLNISKSYNSSTAKGTLTAPIEVGEWQLSCVGAENIPTLIGTTSGTVSANAPMYKYVPTLGADGKSTNADELFTMYFDSNGLGNGVEILANQTESLAGTYVRNVAKVRLVVKSPSEPSSLGINELRLYDVPSTISYLGNLYPDKDTPNVIDSLVSTISNFQHSLYGRKINL